MPEDKFKKIFSRNLLYYMKKNNKTQSDIVTDLGINKSAISTWVNGTRLPRMDKVDMLARYFHIRRSDLIEEHPLELDPNAPLDPRLVQIAKQLCRQDPVVLDVYDSEDKGKLVDYAELLYRAQDSRHLATAAHSSSGKVRPETMAQMEDDDLWK